VVNECRATAIEYMCAKFGVDSSSHFPFAVQTNRQKTDKQTEKQTDNQKTDRRD